MQPKRPIMKTRFFTPSRPVALNLMKLAKLENYEVIRKFSLQLLKLNVFDLKNTDIREK